MNLYRANTRLSGPKVVTIFVTFSCFLMISTLSQLAWAAPEDDLIEEPIAISADDEFNNRREALPSGRKSSRRNYSKNKKSKYDNKSFQKRKSFGKKGKSKASNERFGKPKKKVEFRLVESSSSPELKTPKQDKIVKDLINNAFKKAGGQNPQKIIK